MTVSLSLWHDREVDIINNELKFAKTRLQLETSLMSDSWRRRLTLGH